MMLMYFLGGLTLWNTVVFVAYALDKRRAVKNQWRLPEKNLLFMSLCLGGVGAFLAGTIYRHKTRKWYFAAAWYLGMILIAAAVYLVWRSR